MENSEVKKLSRRSLLKGLGLGAGAIASARVAASGAPVIDQEHKDIAKTSKKPEPLLEKVNIPVAYKEGIDTKPPKEIIIARKTLEQKLREARPKDRFLVEIVGGYKDPNVDDKVLDPQGKEYLPWHLQVVMQEKSDFATYFEGVLDFVRTYLNREGELRQRMENAGGLVNREKLRYLLPAVLYEAVAALKTPISIADAVPLFGESFVSEEVLKHWKEFGDRNPNLLERRNLEYATFREKALAIERRADISNSELPPEKDGQMRILVTTVGDYESHLTAQLDPVRNAFKFPLALVTRLMPKREHRYSVV